MLYSARTDKRMSVQNCDGLRALFAYVKAGLTRSAFTMVRYQERQNGEKMNKGKLYGVGVGPGDKELLTVKAIRIIREADIVASPVMKNGGRAAYDIAAPYLENKKIIEFTMPMTKNKDELEKNYSDIAEKLAELLDEGKNIAFITLGDVTVYSTYMQIDRLMKERGYDTELVPGITSFCAAAARIGTALCERNEPLVIIPASYDISDRLMDLPGTKVFMKAGSSGLELRDMLRDNDIIDKAVMIERCGMENERIVTDLNEMKGSGSYFSLFIVKE